MGDTIGAGAGSVWAVTSVLCLKDTLRCNRGRRHSRPGNSRCKGKDVKKHSTGLVK